MGLFKVQHIKEIGGVQVNLDPVPELSELEQIWPAKAVHNDKAIDKIEDEAAYAEEKLDGERLVIHFMDNGEKINRATTRRQSVKTGLLNEKTNNVPHLRSMWIEELAGTVVDGEVMPSTWGREQGTLGALQSIMNSTYENAIEKQEQYGFVQYKLFDVIKFKGEWCGHLPLSMRLRIREQVLETINKAFPGQRFIDVPQSVTGKENFKPMFERIVAAGGEGLVVKDLTKAYGDTNAWLKMKKEETFDVFITGYEMSKSGEKYAGLIGTLLVSVYDDEGHVVEVGKVIPGNDEQRKQFTEDFESIRGKVLEVKAQEATRNGRFRHGRILRWREDKGAEQCLLNQFNRE